MLTLIVIMMMGLLSQKEGDHELKEHQIESLQLYKAGNANLLAHQPWHGLGDLQKAASLLPDKSDPSSALLGFFISFSQIAAFDVLGLDEQTMQSMDACIQSFNAVGVALEQGGHENTTSLSKSFNEIHQADLEYLRKLAYFTSSDPLRQFADSFALATEDNYGKYTVLLSKLVRDELEQSVECLKKIACLAPSSEVRKLLMLMVDACSGMPGYFEESFNQAA